MKSVVKGCIKKKEYSVVDNLKTITVGDENNSVFMDKPRLQYVTSVPSWKDILTVNGKIYYNGGEVSECGFNISEDETVHITKTVYRADLDEMHVFTDKVVETIEVDKVESEERFERLLADFNEQMINSNKSMLAYCKLHKLVPRETDCEEVFKLVYPGKRYKIIDGAMGVVEKTMPFEDKMIHRYLEQFADK